MKKVISALLCCLVAFSLMAPVFAVESAPAKRNCMVCGTSFNLFTTRTYEHDETFPCSHGKTGRDRYAVYEVKENGTCGGCGYVYSNTTEDHVFVRCNGV